MLVRLIEIVRTEMLEFVSTVSTLKLFIQLHIPRIESEGNFGVNVQEETAGELSKSEDNAFEVLTSITKVMTFSSSFWSSISLCLS